MTVGVIINPTSGRGGREPATGPRRASLAQQLLARAGATGEVVLSRSAAHAIEVAQAFVRARADVVVAWGGDGTVNLVAGPLIGTSTALGIVPSGSGDGAAGSLNLPKPPEMALARALSGSTAPIDVMGSALPERRRRGFNAVGHQPAGSAACSATSPPG
jgi:diacylglycerol kinase (ATP)